tara:strand:+ start:508 stop:645 length:138 start_codon:yes stop_codon:yes gene_type:complete
MVRGQGISWRLQHQDGLLAHQKSEQEADSQRIFHCCETASYSVFR